MVVGTDRTVLRDRIGHGFADPSLLAQALSTRHVTVVALHPGWVRTDMGGQNAALSVEESAAGLLHVIDRLTPDDSGSFLDWQGQSLPW